MIAHNVAILIKYVVRNLDRPIWTITLRVLHGSQGFLIQQDIILQGLHARVPELQLFE